MVKDRHLQRQDLDSIPLKMPEEREKRNQKSRRGEKKNLAYDVDKYTKRGTREIQNGDLSKAIDYFERAFVKAEKLEASYPIRACAFNLGAVYIAAKEPEKGLEMLQRAIPPRKQNDGKSNGDLYYNFALGYESLNNQSETTKYLELALEEYQSEKGNYRMEGEVASKLASLYMDLREWLSGARANGLAARAYSMLGDPENQALSTSHEATCLFQGRRHDLALQIADTCMIVCQKVPQGARLGSIYNELGLTYSQCRDFGKAVTCFELALPLSRSPWGEKSQEAVILQNLGAIYNTVGDFRRAIGFHEEAARRYADLNNRNAQGKCFTNLAFAYSQLQDTERAGEFYHLTLQSARDTGDAHAEWQSFEGLGAVAFNKGLYEKAVQYFKMALTLVSTCEVNKAAQDRIVAKLTDSIHFLANADTLEEESREKHVDILINDEPRPPTREELRQREILALRRGEALVLRKRPNEFETVALGVSEYSTDDDASLERRSYTRSRPRSRRASRKAKRASSLSSAHTAVPVRKQTEVDVSTIQQPERKMKLTRRISSVPRDMTDGPRKRNFNRSLLRADSNDSEEDREKFVNRRRGASSSDEEPNDILKREMYPEAPRPSSRHKVRSTSIVEATLSRSIKRVDMPDQESIPKQQQGRETPSSFYSERMSISEDDVRSIQSKQSRKYGEEREEERLQTNKAVEVQQVSEVVQAVTEREKNEREGTQDEEAASQQINGTQEEQEEEKEEEKENGEKEKDMAQRKKDEKKKDSESETESESEGDGEKEEHCEEGLKTDLTKLPPAPPVPMQQSLNATYLPPMKREEKSEEEEEEDSSEEETESSEEDKKDHKPQYRYSRGNYMSTARPNRISSAHSSASDALAGAGEDMGDPIYQTIRSAKSTAKELQPQPGPSHETDEGPPLPPRPSFDKMSRVEMEAFLQDYQKRRDETIRKREEDMETDEDAPKQNKKKGSKACVVM